MKKRGAVARAAPVLLDTGLLVALYDATDPLHDDAVSWLRSFDGRLVTVEAVLTESAFFMPADSRAALADLVARGYIELHAVDAAACQRIAAILRKYADADPDWADACLVWLAEKTGIARIATVDRADFMTYRINGRTRFDLVSWMTGVD